MSRVRVARCRIYRECAFHTGARITRKITDNAPASRHINRADPSRSANSVGMIVDIAGGVIATSREIHCSLRRRSVLPG